MHSKVIRVDSLEQILDFHGYNRIRVEDIDVQNEQRHMIVDGKSIIGLMEVCGAYPLVKVTIHTSSVEAAKNYFDTVEKILDGEIEMVS